MDPFEQDMIAIGDTDHCAAICKKCRNKGSKLCRVCQSYEYLEDEVFPGTPQAEAIRRKSPWISVKDRLPKPEELDKYSRCLVYGHWCNPDYPDDVRYFVDIGEYKNGRGFEVDYDYEFYTTTHWRPMIDPPKEV